MSPSDPARRRERVGLLFAGLCALNGGFVPAVAKLTTGAADPMFVATTAALIAALCAAVVLGVRGELSLLVARRSGPALAVIGALGTATAYTLFFAGTARATAIDAALCLQIEPAYSLLAAWVFLGHRPTLRRIGATGLLLAGIVLAIGTHGFSGSSGVWLLLATPLCWQASHLIVLRRLVGVEPTVLSGARFLYGGAMLALVWLASGGLTTAPTAGTLATLWPWLLGQGVILTYVGTLYWYQAVIRLDLARTTAIVVPSIPLLSFVASFLLLGEVATPRQWVGLGLVAAGVLLFVTAMDAASAREPASAAAADVRDLAPPTM